MRILHVTHTFPPDSVGGTETYVGKLAAAQRADGDEPALLAGCDERRFPTPTVREREAGFDVLRVRAPTRDLARLEGLDDTARDALTASLSDGDFDAVHVHHWHNLSSDLVACCARLGVPAVVTLHDYFTTCPFFFRLPDLKNPCAPDLPREVCVRCVGRIAGDAPAVLDSALRRREEHFANELRSARAAIVLSEAQGALLSAYPPFVGIDFDVLPLPGPDPVPHWPATEGAAGAERDGPLRIVSWGGLEPGKGLQTVVDACRRLERPRAVELHHHGRTLDEEFRAALVGSAQDIHLELHGPFDRESELGKFAHYDLAIFPSHFLETHGYVVDEALALGLPVVVSDRGAPRERLGECGWVVPAGDAQALAVCLQRLLDEPAVLERARDALPLPAPTWGEHLAAIRAMYGREPGGR